MTREEMLTKEMDELLYISLKKMAELYKLSAGDRRLQDRINTVMKKMIALTELFPR